MALGEADAAAARRRRGPDGQALGLDELDRRIPAARGVDVRAGHEHGPPGAAQPLGQRGDLPRLGLRPAADRARDLAGVVERLDLDQPVVHRDRHERRSRRRERRVVDRLGQRERDIGGARRLVAPLDIRLGHLDRVAVGQGGLHRHQRARLLTGGHEQRGPVGARVEDRPDAVADAGRRVQVDVRDVAAGLREPVGHAHRDGLLQAEHVAEVLRQRPEHRQLRGAGVAEDRRHPALAKQLEGRVANSRHSPALPSVVEREGYRRRPPGPQDAGAGGRKRPPPGGRGNPPPSGGGGGGGRARPPPPPPARRGEPPPPPLGFPSCAWGGLGGRGGVTGWR